MPRQPILAGERMSRTLSGWLVAAVCIILADTANAAMSGRSSGSAQRQPIASRLPDTAFQSDAAIFSRDNTKVAGSGARSRGQIALDLHRIRTRRPFQGTLRTDSDNASDDGIHLNLCGVIVAPPEAPPPFIFLSAETTRGPPRAGAQSPRLFDGARDRPAPHPCASFRSPGVPSSRVIVGTPRNLSAHSYIGGGQGERLGCCGRSLNQTEPNRSPPRPT